MSPAARRLIRDNLFLVAAVLLPLVVVGLFLVAAAIPRWTVPPPAYDLLFRMSGPYQNRQLPIAVAIDVVNGQVEATAAVVAADAYPQPVALFVFDHTTMLVRQVPLGLPRTMAPGDPPQTIVVDALRGRRVIDQLVAPDGYTLRPEGSRGGGGLIGDIFGMGRYDSRLAIVRNGRVIAIPVPADGRFYYPPASAVGWISPASGQP